MEKPFSQATSKVTVEYWDPHGVYKLLAPGLIPRLPLRNLHWQSHAGPLRSIDTLHVELLPAGATDMNPDPTPDSLLPQRKRTDSSAAKDDGFQTQIGGKTRPERSSRSRASNRSSSTPARRHQIPGLRTTPYLKVLLVRCDDSDSYKGSVRAEVREWIKSNTGASGSSKKTSAAEKHDAFEWLILHLVVPNTVAATQPRVAGKWESASEKSAASIFRTGSTTLLEKFRADFNGSSKGMAVDRIAQIRIGVNDVPYDSLPRVVPAVPSGYKETAEDSEEAWSDLLSKFRSLILMSFDARVSQYEEDIKDKDARRTLPGWNFCTFFILKEGLARGFESVGLVEDALVGYDELSVGLDMVLQDQAASASGSAANTLLSFTDDLKRTVDKALAAAYEESLDEDELFHMATPSAGPDAPESFDDIPISGSKKPYRELILENKVSVLDFRCYIFARQISLLLRLGNAWSTREELLAKLKEQQESIIHGVAPRAPPPKEAENEHENLAMLAEICHRTVEFIPLVCQVMRADIEAAMAERVGRRVRTKCEDGKEAETHTGIDTEVVDKLVASFAFSIAQQVLAQTSTKALPIPPSTLDPSRDRRSVMSALSFSPTSPMSPMPPISPLPPISPMPPIPDAEATMHPSRRSSLRISKGRATDGNAPLPSPNFFPGPGQNVVKTEHDMVRNKAFLKAGLEDLAARRAELYALSRNVLKQLGKTRGWADGWADVPVISESATIDLVDVDLQEDSNTVAKEPEEPTAAGHGPTSALVGVHNKLLRAALANSDDFYRLYETLTDKALRHYTVASHTHSVQACLADLAVLKFHLGDYGGAAAYFWRTTPFFGESGWSLLELSMLVMYSKCLKQLQQTEDYVRVVLKLLSKAAAAERERQQQRCSLLSVNTDGRQGLPDNKVVRGLLADLLAESQTLPNEVPVALQAFFSGVEVDGTAEYGDGRDSVSILVKLTSLLADELRLDSARVRMVAQIAASKREIWFEAAEGTAIRPGRNRVMFTSKVVIPGTYDVDRIELGSSKVRLQLERDVRLAQCRQDVLQSPRITIYHRLDTLNIKLTPSGQRQLGRSNKVEVEVGTGWNDIISVQVRLKSATGGLRLLAADAQSVGSAHDFIKKPEGCLFSFGAVGRNESVKIRVPYTVEQEVQKVSIRIDVTYTTEHGTFVFSKTPSAVIALGLGVNVQDVFKHDALFSRFTITTSSHSPVRLYRSELMASDLFDADIGLAPVHPVLVFPRQPASLLYKVRRKKGVPSTANTNRTMYLKLYYSLVGDEISHLVERSIVHALQHSPLRKYGRLLVDTVVPHVEKEMAAVDLERAALLGSVSTACLREVDWVDAFRGLGKADDDADAATVLATWLRDWLDRNLDVVMGKADKEPTSIIIPVAIPSVTIVHTTDIRLSKLAPSAVPVYRGEMATASTNQPLAATLHLKWTRIWDTATAPQQMTDLEFSYDITAPPDNWLVGGRRKGHFVIPAPSLPDPDGWDELSSSAETEADIAIVLIPLRQGFLPYPSVEVREVGNTGSGAAAARPAANGPKFGSGRLGQDDSGQYETDARNLGETVRVVPDRERVTLSLDASASGGGPLVLEVGRRGAADAGRVLA